MFKFSQVYRYEPLIHFDLRVHETIQIFHHFTDKI